MQDLRNIELGLTFDDVLLKPKLGLVSSRSEVDISSDLTKNIRLHIPIIAANMDTVCESEMAIFLARKGGFGFIHRFMSIEDQTKEVRKVKRFESHIIENPYTIEPSASIKDAKAILETKGVSGLIVVDSKNHLSGMLTSRDLVFEEDDNTEVQSIMSTDIVTGPENITISQAKELLHGNRIEKLPLVNSENKIVGLITSKDILKQQAFPISTKDNKGRLAVGAAIGVAGDFLKRAESLIELGVDSLALDIAHGHSQIAISALRKIKAEFGDETSIIVGNVATADGAQELVSAGADGIKVGVGPGSICITRIVTGAGVPQLTAINDCALAIQDSNIPIIADGGIRNSGDIVKALMAGASTVMLGGMLAGTKESPGVPIVRRGKTFRMIRGMASMGAAIEREKRESKKEIKSDAIESLVPEGVEGLVPYKGSAENIIAQLIGGIKSGISYCGGKNIKEAKANASFIRMTRNGIKESGAHDITVL